MLNALLGLGGSLLSGLFGGGGGGNNPGALASMLAGGATAQRIPGQTRAGEYAPENSDQGQTYNYIPIGATQVDPALISMILQGLQGGNFSGNGGADARLGSTFGVSDPYSLALLTRMMQDPSAGRALDRGTTAGNLAYSYGTGAAPNFAAQSGDRANSLLSGYDRLMGLYNDNPFIQQSIQRGGQVGDALTGRGGSITDQGAGLASLYGSAADSALNNPFSGQALSGAQTAGGMMTDAASDAYGRGGSLSSTAMQGLPAASSVLNTAFDPQNALYARTLGKTMDQLGVYLANTGLTSSGAGAGIASDALRDFNIDWQNNQLGRQTQGLSAFNQGVGGTGQNLGAGADLQSGAAANYGVGSAMPYSTYSGLSADRLGVLGQLGTGLSTGAELQGYGLGMQGQGANFAASNYSSLYDPLQSAYNSYATNGLSGYTGLTDNMNSLYGSAVNNTMMGGTMPYDLSTGITNNQYGALGNYYNMGQGGAGALASLNNQTFNQNYNWNNAATTNGLNYLNAVMNGSNNAANATRSTATITGNQNAGAAAALSPLIQSGMNWLGGQFNQPSYSGLGTSITNRANSDLARLGFG